MELKGDMNLQVADPSNAHIKLILAPFSTDFGSDLQFKQHPHVAKFAPNQEKIIALKDPSRAFPVGQALAVLKWRYAGQDESYVPLSSEHLFLPPHQCCCSHRSFSLHAVNCWPSPSNDGTCDVNIEYELEHDHITLYDVTIAIPLPTGSYPTVSDPSSNWSLNPSTHTLDWSIPRISADERSGTLEFSVGGDDVGAFFPVKVTFVAQGSLAGIGVARVTGASGADEVVFSSDAVVSAEEYVVL
jgi:hypothetical protein